MKELFHYKRLRAARTFHSYCRKASSEKNDCMEQIRSCENRKSGDQFVAKVSRDTIQSRVLCFEAEAFLYLISTLFLYERCARAVHGNLSRGIIL